MSEIILPSGRRLVFDEAAHTYTLDGKKRMAGTHELMEAHGIVKPPSPEAMPWVERGRRIHWITQLHDENDLDEADVESVDRPYLDAWKRFSDERKVKWEGVEQLTAYEDAMAATVLDRVGIVDGDPALANLKTGKPDKCHGVQVWLERLIFNDDEEERRLICVYLDGGDYHIKDYTDIREDQMAARAIIASRIAVVEWKKPRRRQSKVTA